jgi:alcohol dehydrogenase
MRAFILDRYGSADRVRAGDMPDPEPREDDVLVQIHAAGVNLLDSKIRNGEFRSFLRYRLPLILGHAVAGVVVRVGSRVRRFKPGDEVYARPADGRVGAFAEFIAIKEDDVAIKPTALTMAEAASIPLVGLTAWQALIESANLKARTKGAHPRGLGWCGHICHPAGEARRRDGGDDHEHGQRGSGQKSRGRRRDRLQEGGLRGRAP